MELPVFFVSQTIKRRISKEEVSLSVINQAEAGQLTYSANSMKNLSLRI